VRATVAAHCEFWSSLTARNVCNSEDSNAKFGSCRNGTAAFAFRRKFWFSVACGLIAMAKAAVVAFARRLRTTSVLQDSFLAHERRRGILENESFGQVHNGLVFSFPSIGSCRRELHGVPASGRDALRWRVGGESKQEDFTGCIRALVTRSFATRGTQLRRLAKQPVKRDGPRPGGRPIRDRAMVRVTGRGNFQRTEGSASHSNSDAAGFRKPWNPRHLDAPRSFANSEKRLDRSNVFRPRSFKDFQLRRRGFEDTEAEGRLPCTYLI